MAIFWDLPYCDALKAELLSLPTSKQKSFFLEVFERMGAFIEKNDDAYAMTFREYFEAYERS